MSGALFIFAMLAVIIISSPTLMDFQIFKQVVHSWAPFQPSLLGGYARDTTGEYNTGLINWLKYFGFHYMKGYFFFFSFFALIVGSISGTRVYLNRILLGWCTVTSIFLAYFVALKNFQYMLPVAVPLFCAAFLFPAVTETNPEFESGRLAGKTTNSENRLGNNHSDGCQPIDHKPYYFDVIRDPRKIAMPSSRASALGAGVCADDSFRL